jgi:SSS family solute:Na+ symporter
MSTVALNISVMALYFLAMIAIGIWSHKKVKAAVDFNIGGRQIGPWVTSLSFVATYFSSVLIIGGGAFGYQFGMATIWIAAFNVLFGATLCWIILGKRVRHATEALDVHTISGYFAKRYKSPSAGIFSAAVIALFLILYNVGVLKGMANAFEGLMGWPYWMGVLISGIVILFYVSTGGYFAVVWTGFFQAMVMIFAMIMMGFYAIHAAGGFTALQDKLAALPSKTPLGFISTPGDWGWAGLLSFACVTSLGTWAMPQLVVRFYSIKSHKMLRIGTIVVTIATAAALFPYISGAASRVILGKIDNPDLAIPLLTKQVLPSWGAAIFLAGVIAAGMSTFAGVLIVISGAVVRDIMKNGLKKKLDDKREVKLGRIFSVVVGLISVCIALKPPALILVITVFSWAVIASTNFWPMLFGIYWKRANKAGAVASMVLGASSALIWSALKNPYGIHGYFIGTAVGLAAIVVVSLLTQQKAAVKAKIR